MSDCRRRLVESISATDARRMGFKARACRRDNGSDEGEALAPSEHLSRAPFVVAEQIADNEKQFQNLLITTMRQAS